MARTQVPGTFVRNNTINGQDIVSGTAGQILVANASGQFTPATVSGNATMSPSGVLTVTGGGNPQVTNVTAISATTTLTATQAGLIACSAPTANIIITLPAASSVSGSEYAFIRTDGTANNIIIQAPSGNMSGLANVNLSYQYQTFVVKSNGTNWYVKSAGPTFGMLVSSQMPAYFNTSSGLMESIDREVFCFQTISNNARNLYLSNDGSISSQSPNGYTMPRNGILKAFWAQQSAAQGSAITWTIYKNNAVLTSFTQAASAASMSTDNINISFVAGDQLGLYMACNNNVQYPQAFLEIAWHD